MPLPCVEIKLDNINEDGNGEICVRGDTVMLGYYKRPALTKEVLEEDGWFHTGDYGCLTKKGQLMITGRKKNLIVLTNGKNIFPEEIEEHLQTIPYIGEVVVFGICNKSGQEESLGAEVFLNAEMVQEMGITNPEEALKKDMLRVCANLPAYKHIARFYIRPVEFEKTTTNKIRRSSLIFRQAVTTFSSDHSDEEQ
jgi:long-chain acyl-CoA synthetase